LDDFIIAELRRVNWFIYVPLALLIVTRPLILPYAIDRLLLYILLAAFTFRVVAFLQASVAYVLTRATAASGGDEADISTIRSFRWLINGFIWLIALLFILANFGVNITSVIAGLGIGGIALALASQNILVDLFSSVIILLDRPFRVGDVIMVGDVTGTVEEIGVKTSRLRSTAGEEVIVSNSALTSSRIHNFKRMHQRRVVTRFGVTYQTTPEQCKRIPPMVREIFSTLENVQLERIHLTTFGESALIYEMAYVILNSDYTKYLDLQQNINFMLMETLAKLEVQFAYPTRTIRIQSTL
jgi:small-conductance mechanosensitive channel